MFGFKSKLSKEARDVLGLLKSGTSYTLGTLDTYDKEYDIRVNELIGSNDMLDVEAYFSSTTDILMDDFVKLSYDLKDWLLQDDYRSNIASRAKQVMNSSGGKHLFTIMVNILGFECFAMADMVYGYTLDLKVISEELSVKRLLGVIGLTYALLGLTNIFSPISMWALPIPIILGGIQWIIGNIRYHKCCKKYKYHTPDELLDTRKDKFNELDLISRCVNDIGDFIREENEDFSTGLTTLSKTQQCCVEVVLDAIHGK